MKIICVDNFARETHSDTLVAENITNERYGQRMVDALNSSSGEDGEDFFKLVPDDHKLHEYDPNR